MALRFESNVQWRRSTAGVDKKKVSSETVISEQGCDRGLLSGRTLIH
jgi:hypothetical protein